MTPSAAPAARPRATSAPAACASAVHTPAAHTLSAAAATGACASQTPAARALAAAALLALAACGTTPPAPHWQATAHASAQRATQAWLVGDERTEAAEHARAQRALASTARPDLLAQLQLLRCATRVAALAAQPCTGPHPAACNPTPADTAHPAKPGTANASTAQSGTANANADKPGTAQSGTDQPAPLTPAACTPLPDATPEQHAYARYLAGRATAADAPLLPPHHRPLAAGAGAGAGAPEAMLAAISDPLSRLVAAGVLHQRGQATPGVIAQAVATASAQGWRRPLRAWLQLQHTQAQATGATTEAARLQRRLDLLTQP